VADDSLKETGSGKLSFATFLSMFIRSFLIQGSFSQKYRQNTGFLFCINPVGKKLWKNDSDYQEFCHRHLDYYNGNPFMITLVLGAVARLEEQMQQGEGMTGKTISGFKKAVGAATGSVGDRLFWSTLRPLAIIIGILSIYHFGIWGVIPLLVIFNIPNALLRWHWLRHGYELGTNVIGEIKNETIQRAETLIGRLNAILLGFLTIILLRVGSITFAGPTLFTIAVFFISLYFYKRNRSVSFVVLLFLAAIILAAFAIFLLG